MVLFHRLPIDAPLRKANAAVEGGATVGIQTHIFEMLNLLLCGYVRYSLISPKMMKNSGSSGKRVPETWIFAPKGSISQPRVSLAPRGTSPWVSSAQTVLPCKGYIKSAILMSVRRLRHSRENRFYGTFRPRNSKSPQGEFTVGRYRPFSCCRYSFAG